MPSQRRIRTTIILSVTALLVLIYISTGSSSTRTSEFYTRTLAALDQKQPGGGSGSGSDAGGGARRKVAGITTHDEPDPGPGPGVRGSSNGQKAPDQRGAAVAAPKKDAITGADIGDTDGDTEQRDDDTDGPPRVHRKKRPVQDDDDVRSGAAALREQKPGKQNNGASAGKVVEIPDDAPPAADAGKDAARAADGVAKVGNTGSRVKKPDGAQKALLDTEADTGKDVGKASGDEKVQAPDEIEVELDAILKRSPIIIFSKTYCRFSKNAKRILLKTYKIVPTPYVVELDQHPLGPGLQARLTKLSGRRTVPNILVNGKSMGGSDDLDALEAKGALREELIALGGKRLMEVTKS